MSSYHNPVQIIKTDDWKNELSITVKDLKISNPVIVTSPGNRRRLKLDEIYDPSNIFSDVDSNPTFQNCENSVLFCQKKSFDGVVALGGGSAMDLAKVVMSHLCLEKTDIHELINHKDPYPKEIPSVFLPTTHGTASEVTMWGTVWNMEEEKKYSISHPSLYPTVAILDGNLTLTLPLDISITTVMDALSHSFESIWNKNANPTSTDFAISAICSILEHGPKLKDDPSKLKIRNELLKASTVAGLAFSNTTTAAAHSMSYPLTIHHGIPHGIASSLSLVPLFEINRSSIQSDIDIICNFLNVSYDELINRINQIPEGVISYKLSDWGVKRQDLKFLSNESFTKGRMDNNIVDLSNKDVLQIFEQLYN